MYLSVFPQREFIFCLITAMWLLFTDVLEPLPLLSCVSTCIDIPQSGKYRVSGIFQIPHLQAVKEEATWHDINGLARWINPNPDPQAPLH